MEPSKTFYDEETTINLYVFFKNYNEKMYAQVYPDILMSTGYISSSKDGRLKYPIKRFFMNLRRQ